MAPVPDQDLAQAIETLKRSQAMLEPVLASFERRLRQFGADPKSAFWKNKEWQTRRYYILSRLFDDADRQGGVTIIKDGMILGGIGVGGIRGHNADEELAKVGLAAMGL